MNRMPALLCLALTATLAGSASWAGGGGCPDDALSLASDYGLIGPATDPNVIRAQAVFARVLAAADKKGNYQPALFLLNTQGTRCAPFAAALPDGNVEITRTALRACYGGVSPSAGDARLAFILGHELAHLAKGDFWHAGIYELLRSEEGKNSAAGEAAILFLETTDAFLSSPADRSGGENGPVGREPKAGDDARRSQAYKAACRKEMEADAWGLVYMAMAGYDPSSIIGDNDSFFLQLEKQGLITADENHPGPAQRAAVIRAQMDQIAGQVELFRLGVQFFKLGKFAEATPLFEKFSTLFPSREVYSDLGLCRYELALEELDGCDLGLSRRFYLPVALDARTLAESMKGVQERGTKGGCLDSPKFTQQIEKAIACFRLAADKDPSYAIARQNLAAAFLLREDPAGALPTLDEADKLVPGDPALQTLRAIAVWQFGLKNGIHAGRRTQDLLASVLARDPRYPPALYNRAAVLREEGNADASRQVLGEFVKAEPAGIYSEAARARLGTHAQSNAAGAKADSAQRPTPKVPLLAATEQTKAALASLQPQVPLAFGTTEARLAGDSSLRALVYDREKGVSECQVLLVEQKPPSPLAEAEARRMYGSPHYTLVTPEGSFWGYGSFGLEMSNGLVKAILFTYD